MNSSLFSLYKCMNMLKTLGAIALCLSLAQAVQAQTEVQAVTDSLSATSHVPASTSGLDWAERFQRRDYHSPDSTSSLRLMVESLLFFQDNEYDGGMTKGYTLPGAWLQPRLIYTPQANIQLELGLHALTYHGANKYPNYAFRDIALWKGSQYQEGAHILPVFRAVARLGNFTLVLGDLYARDNHGLILPLYNPELLITADPEKGFQLRYERPRYQLDTWVDWQSFIFDQVHHQEAFTIGLNQKIWLTNPRNTRFSLTTPIQILAQHRGGEQDATEMGVQTISNASLGLHARWHVGQKVLNAVEFEAHRLLAYQQAGDMWPFNVGHAWWAGAAVDMFSALRCRLGAFMAKDFVSLYGVPFFSTLSTKVVGGRFSSINTAYWGLEYSKVLGKYITLGAKLNGYLTGVGQLAVPNGEVRSSEVQHAFSVGLYLRANPNFLLRLFKS